MALLSRLKLDTLIGEGATARVFSAQAEGGEWLAVKVVPRDDDATATEAAALTLLGATLPAARVSLPPVAADPPAGHSHPHIVHLACAPEYSTDKCFFVMSEGETDLLERIIAYCDARDAAAELDAASGRMSAEDAEAATVDGPPSAVPDHPTPARSRVDAGGLPFSVVRSYFAQAASALRYCHGRGVFHGDLKPENCLLSTVVDEATGHGDDVLILCDCGSASLARVSRKANGSIAYAAPEVLPLFHAAAVRATAAPAGRPAAASGPHSVGGASSPGAPSAAQGSSPGSGAMPGSATAGASPTSSVAAPATPSTLTPNTPMTSSSSGDPTPIASYDASAADVWSLGVLLFVMLAGAPPFTEASLNDPDFAALARGEWRPPDDFPPLASELLMRILRIRPSERPSIGDILAHAWTRGAASARVSPPAAAAAGSSARRLAEHRPPAAANGGNLRIKVAAVRAIEDEASPPPVTSATAALQLPPAQAEAAASAPAQPTAAAAAGLARQARPAASSEAAAAVDGSLGATPPQRGPKSDASSDCASDESVVGDELHAARVAAAGAELLLQGGEDAARERERELDAWAATAIPLSSHSYSDKSAASSARVGASDDASAGDGVSARAGLRAAPAAAPLAGAAAGGASTAAGAGLTLTTHQHAHHRGAVRTPRAGAETIDGAHRGSTSSSGNNSAAAAGSGSGSGGGIRMGVRGANRAAAGPASGAAATAGLRHTSSRGSGSGPDGSSGPQVGAAVRDSPTQPQPPAAPVALSPRRPSVASIQASDDDERASTQGPPAGLGFGGLRIRASRGPSLAEDVQDELDDAMSTISAAAAVGGDASSVGGHHGRPGSRSSRASVSSSVSRRMSAVVGSSVTAGLPAAAGDHAAAVAAPPRLLGGVGVELPGDSLLDDSPDATSSEGIGIGGDKSFMYGSISSGTPAAQQSVAL